MRIKKWGCLALAALLLWGLLSGCAQDGREELLEKAERYLRQGDTTLAVRILDTYLEQEPGNIRARELFARYYHATEQFLLEAEAYYRLIKEAQDHDISLEGYYLACAGAYLQLGYREDALEIYQEGAARLPQAGRLRQKADELNAALHPPAQLAEEPDKSGIYDMTAPGPKAALRIVISGAEGDAARVGLYREAIETFIRATGHTVEVKTLPSGAGLEAYPEKADLYFTATRKKLDALATAGALVSLEEMRKDFPALGGRYREELCTRAGDGKTYALPVRGGWSGLFINRETLESCGVSLPGEGYTWEQFLKDCERVKKAGIEPIIIEDTQDGRAAWMELGLWNNAANGNQNADLPWVRALEDLKELYDEGYIAWGGEAKDAHKTAASDRLLDGEAAFMLGDDSDCLSLAASAQQRGEEPRQIYVTAPPVKSAAKAGIIASSLAGGWAMGRAAWDDPEKRLAALSLYSRLTALNAADSEGDYGLYALKEDNGAAEKDALQKTLTASFFSVIRGVRPSALTELSAAERNWPTALQEVLMGVLTPQEAAEELEKD